MNSNQSKSFFGIIKKYVQYFAKLKKKKKYKVCYTTYITKKFIEILKILFFE